jgi:hypothetical protein
MNSITLLDDSKKSNTSQMPAIKTPLSDPKVFGSGTWFVLHLLATNANSPDKIDQYIETFKTIISNIKCGSCRLHAMQYFNDNPIDAYRDLVDNKGTLVGMAKYVWQFHNAVNTRLGKPLFDWETAYTMYATPDSGVCTTSCGEGSESNPSVIPTLIPNRTRIGMLVGEPITLRKVPGHSGFRVVPKDY